MTLEIPAAARDRQLACWKADDAESVRAMDLDAAVWQIDCDPDEEIAASARGGLFAIELGVSRRRDLQWGAFPEIVKGEPTASFAVARVAADGAQTLYSGAIPTELLHSRNVAALVERGYSHLRRAILQPPQPCLADKEPASARDSDPPAAGEILAYGARTAERIGRKLSRRMSRVPHWSVGLMFTSWKSEFSPEVVLSPLPGSFIADPFAISVDGAHYVFVEEFPYSTGKGVIAVYRVDVRGSERLGVALERPYHLSFPFVFRHEGRIYMIPETRGSGGVEIYECKSFPLQWSSPQVLIGGISAVDTIVFERSNRWWMLTTVRPEGPSNGGELHVFHATTPLGPWTAHSANPVILDAHRSRNGGLLRDSDGTVYRVAQRPGFTAYGVGFGIYRIDEISPETYRESLVREVAPDFLPELTGTHHAHSDGMLTVFDFCRDLRRIRRGESQNSLQ